MHRIAFSRITLILVVAGIMSVGLASCGGGGDGGGGRNGTIVLPPGNRAPVIVQRFTDITLTLQVGSSFRWGSPQTVDAYFSDPDGDSLTYRVSTSNRNVAEVVLGSPQIVIVQAQGGGTATITVTATDPGGLTARQQFRVTVRQTTSRNQAPVVRTRFQDLTHTVSSQEDQRRTWTFNLVSFFSDPDGDTLTYTARTTNVFFAAVRVTGNQLNVTSGLDGVATITVTATDPGGLTASQSFRLTTTFRPPSNRAPVVRRGIQDVASMTTGQGRSADVSNNFSDPDGDTLTYSARSSATNFVQVSMSGSRLTFTAVQAFSSGQVRITVTARDPHGATAELSFRILDVSAPARRYFGAIAFGNRRNNDQYECSGGYAAFIVSNHTNRVEAEFAALNGCHEAGGLNCGVAEFGSAYGAGNECGALAHGENRNGSCSVQVGRGSTRSAAESDALANCRRGGYSCSLTRGAGGVRFAQCAE